MTTRTVVAFERLGADTVVKLERAIAEIPDRNVNAFVDVTPLPGGTPVTQGSTLLQRLSGHPPVLAGLAAALGVQAGAGPSPLYFRMASAAAEALPWEQLYAEPHGFCTLDPRWPVGRIAQHWRQVAERTFEPPLRVVAVLSAAARTGTPQLQALRAAITALESTAPLPVALHVITGEEAVLDAVTAAGVPTVTAELIKPDASDVCRQIGAARPHLVHVLCHGGMVAGVRTLAFATLADFDAGEQTGSVRLKVADLVDALLPHDPWLVVLAACDTAEAADGPALAHDLVSHGLPAVVGMRRLVDLTDTDRFCGQLYPAVLDAVRAAVDPGGPPRARPIEWAPAMTAARTTLGGPNPDQVDTWSDPVLYVQNDALQVAAPSAGLTPAQAAELRAQLDVWQGVLHTLNPATTAPAVLAEIAGKVADLQAKLGGGQ